MPQILHAMDKHLTFNHETDTSHKRKKRMWKRKAKWSDMTVLNHPLLLASKQTDADLLTV